MLSKHFNSGRWAGWFWALQGLGVGLGSVGGRVGGAVASGKAVGGVVPLPVQAR